MKTSTLRACRDMSTIRQAAKAALDARIVAAARDPELSARDLATRFGRTMDYVWKLVGKRVAK